MNVHHTFCVSSLLVDESEAEPEEELSSEEDEDELEPEDEELEDELELSDWLLGRSVLSADVFFGESFFSTGFGAFLSAWFVGAFHSEGPSTSTVSLVYTAWGAVGTSRLGRRFSLGSAIAAAGGTGFGTTDSDTLDGDDAPRLSVGGAAASFGFRLAIGFCMGTSSSLSSSLDEELLLLSR